MNTESTPSPRREFLAREKLTAVALVHCFGESVSEVCLRFGISRTTWYRWQRELKAMIQPCWGGLGHLSLHAKEKE